MFAIKRKGILAMEELDVEVPAEDVEVIPAPEEVEASAEVVEAEGAVTADLDDLDAGLTTANTLDEVRESVGEAAETEGGISEPEARALDVAVEHMLVSLGMPRARAKIFPAMEGFKEPANRQRTTRLAMEEIGKSLKTLWSKIAAMLQSVWETIFGFIKALATAAGRMEARAQKIKKLAAANKDAKGVEIPAKSAYARLVKGGKIADNLAAAVAELGTDKAINTDYGKVANEFNKIIVEMVDLIGKPDGGAKIDELAGKLGDALPVGMRGDQPESHKLPLGDAEFVMTATAGGKAAFSVELKAPQVKLGEKVQGLSASEAAAVADAVLKDLAKFGQYEKETGAIAATMKSLSAKMGSAVNKIKPDDSEQGKINAGIRTVAIATQSTKAIVARGSSLLRSYNFKTLQAAVDFAGASLAAATKGAGEKKKEEAKQAA